MNFAITNKKTKAQFQQVRYGDGEELPGASLELKTVDGTVIDSWISGKAPHFVGWNADSRRDVYPTEISAPDGV